MQKPEPSKPPREPEAGTLYSASEMHDHVMEAAEEELERPFSELFIFSVASGLLVSFSFVPAAFLAHHGSPAHRELLVAAAYPLGFIFVVLAQHQLELPALAGNIIGGVVLVAMVNHGQSGGGK